MIAAAPVHWYDEIDSTSEEAKRRAKSGDTSAIWIAARQQTAGKGRLGRSWISPPGNLFTTILFPEPGGVQNAARIPFAAALAVTDAIIPLIPAADVRLKWPNDVRVEGAKICGILVESGETNGLVWVTTGIGLNVQYAPDGAGQAAASLRDIGAAPGLQPEHVLSDLTQAFAKRVEQARTDFAGLLRDWTARAEGLGQTVVAGPINARVSGIFESLAEDGGLILRLPDGVRQTIRAGDVELVRRVD